MKLAEALLLRSEYQQKIQNLQQRIAANLKVQENDAPTENPSELLKELAKIQEMLCDLVIKINHRNLQIQFPDGEILADAIAKRDFLNKKKNLLSGIVSMANQKDYRLTRSELKMCVTINVPELQKEVEDIAKESTEIDRKIQSLNWTVDLE